MKHWPFPLTILMAALLVATSSTSADDATDVTFSTKYASGRPKTADFYYEGRAVGRGQEGFQAIVDKIRNLPVGSSVVWGPDYSRCGACSGREPSCVPKFLYPGLWNELERHVKDRRLVLSSAYPGPWPLSIADDAADSFPAMVIEIQALADEEFDAVLDWEVGRRIGINDKRQPEKTVWSEGRWHRFTAGDVEIGDIYELELFFSRLAADARLLVRIRLNEKVNPANVEDLPLELAADIRSLWGRRIPRTLQRGNIDLVIAAPSVLLDPLKSKDETRRITWQNFHGPKTPHEGVAYEINGQFAGMGDKGFEEILARLSQLSPGATVVTPRYEYGGRWALESLGEEEIEQANEQLKEVFPFRHRLNELEKAIHGGKLRSEFDLISPHYRPRTVLDWRSGDRLGKSFVAIGRIVAHDEQPSQPAIRLGWSRYGDGGEDEAGESIPRQMESEAIYTIDDKELGQGVPGFALAMKKIEALAENSIVHVRVCLRTKGPFVCPITFEGHRHFERTGFEPYFGMFPWLIDLARKENLVIEWIPDEGKSCIDCEVNK